MGLRAAKLEDRQIRFVGRGDYSVSEAVFFTRSGKGIEAAMGGRLTAPKARFSLDIPRQATPAVRLDTSIRLPKLGMPERKVDVWLPMLASFWFHVALTVLVASTGTITKELILPPELKQPAPVMVTMNLTLPTPIATPLPVAKVIPKAAPAPKVVPKPVKAPAAPKVAKSAPAPRVERPVARPQPQPKIPMPVVANTSTNSNAGGSPAPKNAPPPAPSAVKSLDFLNNLGKTAGVSKAIITNANGKMDMPGGNYDSRINTAKGAAGGSSLGKGSGQGNVGPIRTGGKFANGNGYGVGAGLGAGTGSGTGVQARVAAGQVHNGSAKLSMGGGLEASGPGTVNEGGVLAVLNKNMERFRYCYEKSLLRNPALAGVVKMAWTITTSGSATSANVVNSQLNDNALHSCLQKTITSLKFPPAKGGNAEVSYPFNFKSSAY